MKRTMRINDICHLWAGVLTVVDYDPFPGSPRDSLRKPWELFEFGEYSHSCKVDLHTFLPFFLVLQKNSKPGTVLFIFRDYGLHGSLNVELGYHALITRSTVLIRIS